MVQYFAEWWDVSLVTPGPFPAKRGRGRPQIGKPVEVRLPDDVLAKVDELAERQGIARAEMLRDLIDFALHEPDPADVECEADMDPLA